MRLLTLLPYIAALLPSLASAGPLGYNLRRHEDSAQGRKQLITTVMVFTRTIVLEIDMPPATSKTVSIEPTPPPAESTPAPEENGPKETVTQVVTVTRKKTATHKQPSATESLSRLKPLPTTEKERTTNTPTTSEPVPEVTEKPYPPPEVPTLKPTSSYTLSRLNPLPEGPAESTPAPSADPATTEATTICETTTMGTTTDTKPTPTPTGFVPPTDPPYSGPFLKENIPVAIKRNQKYNKIKEGDDCDPGADLLACAGTMGKSILQCESNKKYKSVHACPRGTLCFASPKLLAPGVLVTCDTPETAGKKFNMSAEDLLKKIQRKGNGKGKEKEKEKDSPSEGYGLV